MTHASRIRARDDRGSALIVSVTVMVLVLAFGMALLSQVDTQTRDGELQRARASSFQVAEGGLNAQIFALSRRWPDSTSPYPSSCTQGTTTTADCPSSTAIGSTFQNVDQLKSTAWTTQVRDNSTTQPNYWSDFLLTGKPYDDNGDGYVWVRSQALVNGRRRTLVALIRAEPVQLSPPSAQAVVAGHFSATNNGAKVIIDTNGLSDQFTPGNVTVRCTFTTPPATGCAEYEAGKTQVSPERVYSNPAMPNLTDAQGLEALRGAARSSNDYYATGCPSSLTPHVARGTVFIEDASSCNTFGGDYNTAADPGVLVIGKGAISFGGNTNFYGLVYHANLANTSATLVTVGGTATIYGAVVVDGLGGVDFGSSKENVVYDPNVWVNFKGLNAYGTASIVPNTFREISATS